jgi:hypothetical protein
MLGDHVTKAEGSLTDTGLNLSMHILHCHLERRSRSATDDRFWHGRDLPATPTNVRSWGVQEKTCARSEPYRF